MKNSTLIGMTALVIVAMLTLIFINFSPYIIETAIPTKSPFPLDVRGMAVYHRGLPYTLNFEQQQTALGAMTRSVEVKKSAYPEIKGPFLFEKIAIYRFQGGDIELLPIDAVEKNLVFAAPSLDPNVYYMELSGGELSTMLNNAFDH